MLEAMNLALSLGVTALVVALALQITKDRQTLLRLAREAPTHENFLARLPEIVAAELPRAIESKLAAAEARLQALRDEVRKEARKEAADSLARPDFQNKIDRAVQEKLTNSASVARFVKEAIDEQCRSLARFVEEEVVPRAIEKRLTVAAAEAHARATLESGPHAAVAESA
jgi:hypothetical protein